MNSFHDFDVLSKCVLNSEKFQIVKRAYYFSNFLHRNQKRKWSDRCYFDHLTSVAAKVAAYTACPDLISAALLHDSVEDQLAEAFGSPTWADLGVETLEGIFGRKVSEIVRSVTNPSYKDYPKYQFSRNERHKRYCEHLSKCCEGACIIKLCDIIDNCLGIVHIAPEFASYYLKEKQENIDALPFNILYLKDEAGSIIKNELLQLKEPEGVI